MRSENGPDDFEGAEMRRFQKLLFRCRVELFRRMHDVNGIELSQLCPLAEQIIENDPYLSEQTLIVSSHSCFGGNKIREDAFFVRNSFERQFNTLYEVIWILVYKAASELTGTGPYVSQIPNFEIRKEDGVRTIHRIGWVELIRNGKTTMAGALLLLWLWEQGWIDDENKHFIEPFLPMHPGLFEERWQQDIC